jgi:hypothetical protein
MLAAAAILFLAPAAFADDADDVRQMVKKIGEQVAAGKLLDALDNYSAVNDSERDMARSMVELDAATHNVETAVRKKFGDKSWDTLKSAVHAVPRDGGPGLNVKLDGDVATVTFSPEEPPLLFRRFGAAWKVSIPDIMKWAMKQAGATEAQARELEPQIIEVSVDRVRRMVSGLNWLALEIDAGKYATPDAVKSAAAAVMKPKKK